MKNARLVLKAGEACPADTVVFHAQQCAEKYLKALLTLESIDFPGTHDLGILIGLLPATAAIELSAREQRRLTSYATVTRYPGDYEHVTLSEARQAVALARRVRKRVRSLLPGAALRGRKH